MDMSFRALLFVVLAFFLSVSNSTMAGDAKVQADGSTVWQAGVDGVEIEWKPDGSLKRLYSKYSTPVEFADRRGINKAQIISEEKAKGNIIRFMQQSVSSTRIVTEIQTDLNKATQVRQSGSAANVRKTDERTLIENLTEVTTSFASGTLRGVIVLEKGYDDKAQEAWVVVGISEKTIKAASGVRTMTDKPETEKKPGQGSVSTQPSEVRRSNQKDW